MQVGIPNRKLCMVAHMENIMRDYLLFINFFVM